MGVTTRSNEHLRVSQVSTRWGSRGNRIGTQIEVWHDGLNEHRVLFDRYPSVLQQKVKAQLARWDEKWARKDRRTTGKAEADRATVEAVAGLESAEQLLMSTLADRVDWSSLWSSLKDWTAFRQAPTGTPRPRRPADLAPVARPARPVREPASEPSFSFLDRFSRARREAKIQAAEVVAIQAQAQAVIRWEAEAGRLEAEEQQQRVQLAAEVAAWEQAEQQQRVQLAAEVAAWEQAKQLHLQQQSDANAEIDRRHEEYLKADRARPEVIEDFVSLVLSNSRYPDWMDADSELEYSGESGILVVNYQLPTLEQVPTLKRVTYFASREEMREGHLTGRQHEALYDSVCYQIALRTLHELFESDEANVLDAVVFNGLVDAVNSWTGVLEHNCILTVQAGKGEFTAINLASVDPRACFRKLKGVAASARVGVTRVAPIRQLNRSDTALSKLRAQGLEGAVGKITPKGETELTPEEMLVHAIFGEKAPEPSPAPARSSPASDPLVAALIVGGLTFVDRRSKGGRIWVVGGHSLESVLDRVAPSGGRFVFFQDGSKSTGGQPAWYLIEPPRQ